MEADRTTKEENLLIRAQSGDTEAAELYLAAFIPLLNTIARRFCNPVLSTEDLRQAGYMGLLLALQRYERNQNAQFMTYAMPWVLGEMKRALRCATNSPVNGSRSRFITRCLGQLSAMLGREPRIVELAKFCNASPSEIVWALEGNCAPQSLDYSCEESGRTLLETLVSPERIDDQSVDIHLALSRLSFQERTLIVLRYFRDHTQKETAQIMNMSQSQISRMERTALENLRQWLT